MSDAKIKPLGAYVLVEQLEDGGEQVKGGIVIPDSAKEKPQEYKVLAIGTGGKDDKGNDIVFYVKEGDTVLTTKYGGTDVKIGDNEYKLVKQSDILAIVE
jgi:chaperonin GroES